MVRFLLFISLSVETSQSRMITSAQRWESSNIKKPVSLVTRYLEFSWATRSNQPTDLLIQGWRKYLYSEGSSHRLLVHCIAPSHHVARTRNISYFANFPITSFHRITISLHCQSLSRAILSWSRSHNLFLHTNLLVDVEILNVVFLMSPQKIWVSWTTLSHLA